MKNPSVSMLYDNRPARLVPRSDEQTPLIGERELRPAIPGKYFFEGIVDGVVEEGEVGTVMVAGKTWRVRAAKSSIFSDPTSPTRSLVSLEVLDDEPVS